MAELELPPSPTPPALMLRPALDRGASPRSSVSARARGRGLGAGREEALPAVEASVNAVVACDFVAGAADVADVAGLDVNGGGGIATCTA